MATSTSTISKIRTEPKRLPTLVCVGVPANFHEPKPTRSGMYINQRIDLSPEGAGRTGSLFLCYRPEWFDPDFKPSIAYHLSKDEAKALEEYKEARESGVAVPGTPVLDSARAKSSALYVYEKNIYSQEGSPAILQVLGGSPKGFEELVGRLLDLERPIHTDAVRQTIETFVRDNEVRVGYILKQASEKTDEFDANGKRIYLRTPFYSVSEVFWPTEAKLERLAKAASNSFRITFSVDNPF